MTFANFVTIQYKLLIEKMPTFNSLFDSVWTFAIIFVAAYIPLSIIIGYWHRKSQWKVEAEAMFKENEIGATMWLFIIDMIGATLLVKISKGFVGGYELELLLMAVCISLLLTGPGKISIEWDVLKREIFPRGKAIVQQQKDAAKTT